MRSFFVGAGASAIFLAGCGGGGSSVSSSFVPVSTAIEVTPSTAPAPTAKPIATAPPSSTPSAAPSASPTAAATAGPTAAPTPKGTGTPGATPTPLTPPSATPVATPTPTQEPTATAPGQVTVAPETLAFTASGSAAARIVTVSQPAFSGTFAVSACSADGVTIAAVPASTTGPLTVTPRNPGTCTIVVTGGAGRSAALSVVVTTTSVTSN